MQFPLVDLLIALLFLFLSIGWLYGLRKGEEEMRGRLGDDVEVVRLSRRGVQIAFYILFGITILFPIGFLWLVFTGELGWDDTPDFVRGVWLVTLTFGMRYGSRLMIGSHGFGRGSNEITWWYEVEDVTWDRDIGQRAWGVSIMVRTANDKPVKRRFYVRRDLKKYVEELFNRYRPVEQEGASPSPGIADDDRMEQTNPL